MSIVMTQDMPGATRELVEQVTAELNFATQGKPAGLIAHTALEVDGGIRIIDIWETEADLATFGETRLGPAMAAVAQRNGVDLTAMPAMTQTVNEAFDILLP
jgi:hypothetical protein